MTRSKQSTKETLEQKRQQVTSRQEPFVDKTATKLWYEKPSPDNPYISEQHYCHGYELKQLMAQCSYADVLYLLFRGELPDKGERRVFEALMIALVNPGPRHPATRAAMNLGVGKTDPLHILPASLQVISGRHKGAGEIVEISRFLRKNRQKAPAEVVDQYRSVLQEQGDPAVDTWSLLPGFGRSFGQTEIFPQSIVDELLAYGEELESVSWGNELAAELANYQVGWTMPGVAAAVLSDLGFQPKAAAGLFQMLCAPGLLAHGLEFANKPRTAMPYVTDDHYDIKTK